MDWLIDYPSRLVCLKHDYRVILPLIAFHLAIFASYMSVPWSMRRFLARRTDGTPFATKVGRWTVHFIISCGFTHLVAVVMFWWPAYPLLALVLGWCAVVSVYAARQWHGLVKAVLKIESENPDLVAGVMTRFRTIDAGTALERQAVIEEMVEKLAHK